jgi:hypothetical protein
VLLDRPSELRRDRATERSRRGYLLQDDEARRDAPTTPWLDHFGHVTRVPYPDLKPGRIIAHRRIQWLAMHPRKGTDIRAASVPRHGARYPVEKAPGGKQGVV